MSEKGLMRTTLWTQIHEALINDFNNYGIEISPTDNKVVAGKSMTKVINDVVDLICELSSDRVKKLINLDEVDAHWMLCDKSEDYRDGYCDGIIYAEREHKIRGKHE